MLCAAVAIVAQRRRRSPPCSRRSSRSLTPEMVAARAGSGASSSAVSSSQRTVVDRASHRIESLASLIGCRRRQMKGNLAARSGTPGGGCAAAAARHRRVGIHRCRTGLKRPYLRAGERSASSKLPRRDRLRLLPLALRRRQLPADRTGSAALAGVWIASAAVIAASTLAAFRLGFAADPATLLRVNGPRVLLGAAVGGALALAGALRLVLGLDRRLRELEILALSTGAAGGGFIAAQGRAGAAALVAFTAGALAGASAALRPRARARSPEALDEPRRGRPAGGPDRRRRARRNLRTRASRLRGAVRRLAARRSRGSELRERRRPARAHRGSARVRVARAALGRALAARDALAARLRHRRRRGRTARVRRHAGAALRPLARARRFAAGAAAGLRRRPEPPRWWRSTRSRVCSSAATIFRSTYPRRCSRSPSSWDGTASGCASWRGPRAWASRSSRSSLIAGMTLTAAGLAYTLASVIAFAT